MYNSIRPDDHDNEDDDDDGYLVMRKRATAMPSVCAQWFFGGYGLLPLNLDMQVHLHQITKFLKIQMTISK